MNPRLVIEPTILEQNCKLCGKEIKTLCIGKLIDGKTSEVIAGGEVVCQECIEAGKKGVIERIKKHTEKLRTKGHSYDANRLKTMADIIEEMPEENWLAVKERFQKKEKEAKKKKFEKEANNGKGGFGFFFFLK